MLKNALFFGKSWKNVNNVTCDDAVKLQIIILYTNAQNRPTAAPPLWKHGFYPSFPTLDIFRPDIDENFS